MMKKLLLGLTLFCSMTAFADSPSFPKAYGAVLQEKDNTNYFTCLDKEVTNDCETLAYVSHATYKPTFYRISKETFGHNNERNIEDIRSIVDEKSGDSVYIYGQYSNTKVSCYNCRGVIDHLNPVTLLLGAMDTVLIPVVLVVDAMDKSEFRGFALDSYDKMTNVNLAETKIDLTSTEFKNYKSYLNDLEATMPLFEAASK